MKNCRNCARTEPGLQGGFYKNMQCKECSRKSWLKLVDKFKKYTSSDEFKKLVAIEKNKKKLRIKKYYENKERGNA